MFKHEIVSAIFERSLGDVIYLLPACDGNLRVYSPDNFFRCAIRCILKCILP